MLLSIRSDGRPLLGFVCIVPFPPLPYKLKVSASSFCFAVVLVSKMLTSCCTGDAIPLSAVEDVPLTSAAEAFSFRL